MMDHLLNAKVMFPPTPRVLAPAAWVVNQAMRRATIATMPHWMRRLAGVRQPRVVDALITPVMRIAFRLGQANPERAVRMLELLSPSTVPIVAPVLLEIPARRPGTVTPAQARERVAAVL